MMDKIHIFHKKNQFIGDFVKQAYIPYMFIFSETEDMIEINRSGFPMLLIKLRPGLFKYRLGLILDNWREYYFFRQNADSEIYWVC